MQVHQYKYSNFIYKFMLNSDYTFKWLDYVKSTLDLTGHSEIFLNQNSSNLCNVHLLMKQTLIDQFITDWFSRMQLSNKGKLYNLFKYQFEREDYLTSLPKHLYLPILKFRTANHKFPVETGRWSNIPYVNRKCPLCQNDLGDEFHYLMVCNYFTEKRKQLIPNYFHRYPNIIKYQELLKSSNSDILKNLSIFIAHIMNTFTR